MECWIVSLIDAANRSDGAAYRSVSPRFTFSYTEIVDLNFLAASRSLRSPPLVAYQNAQFSATEKSPHLPALQHSGGSLFLR